MSLGGCCPAREVLAIGDAARVPRVVERLGVSRPDEQRALARLMGDEVAQRPAELRTRPAVELQSLQPLVAWGSADRVVFAGQVVGSEAPGHRLLVERIGFGQGVELVRLRLRLGAKHVLDTGKLQDVADLGRVDELARGDDPPTVRLEVQQLHRTQPIAFCVYCNRAMPSQRALALTQRRRAARQTRRSPSRDQGSWQACSRYLDLG
jgi:hypothetical protein